MKLHPVLQGHIQLEHKNSCSKFFPLMHFEWTKFGASLTKKTSDKSFSFDILPSWAISWKDYRYEGSDLHN